MTTTRRDFLKLGGATLVSGVLAACGAGPAPVTTPPPPAATATPQPPPAIPGAQDQSLIFMVAPTIADPYFNQYRNDLLALYDRLLAAAHPADRFYVLADEDTVQAIGTQLPLGRVVIGGVRDVRMRDFAPVWTGEGWTQFVYDPPYMTLRNAIAIQSSFNGWFNTVGVWQTLIPLTLDGGNVVHNGAGRAVVSDRIFADNARRSTDEINATLREMLRLDALAVIPSDPADPTAQASRRVTWLAPNVLGVVAPATDDVRRALAEALPDVTLVAIPHAPDPTVWNEFVSAVGIYVNTLRTPNAIYVPTFDLPDDAAALAAFNAHADRPVIPVRIGPEAQMGVGLHTLTWDAGGEFAARFLASLT